MKTLTRVRVFLLFLFVSISLLGGVGGRFSFSFVARTSSSRALAIRSSGPVVQAQTAAPPVFLTS
jgi:hypothetical protein